MMKRIFAVRLAVAMLLTASAFAEGQVLRVSGQGVVTMTADRAGVVLGVRESMKDALMAQDTVNEKINAIYDALIEAGVEKKDIGTESLYMHANYDYSGSIEKIVGYTASNTLYVQTTQLDKLGEYIDIAFNAGANTLNDVQFSARNSDQAQKDALKLAVENAFEKAEVMAAAAGMKLGAVRVIEESTQNSGYYGYNAAAGAKFTNARIEGAPALTEDTLVQASSLQISAGVTVEFELVEGEH